jgi:Virulence-associated protein E/Bifunctional DNA primase/polymerase, N-terminal
MQLLTETSLAYDSTNLAIAQVLNVADHRHAEAARLLSAGLKLCALHQLSKRPVGESWQVHPVTEVLESVGGYGVLLPANNLCSIDPDNEDAARAGLLRCGFDLEELMARGVRTTSNRPGSGGRSTFKAPPGARWIKFSDKKQGTLLELRAESSNLQDCLPGTTYTDKSGDTYSLGYATERRLHDAPDMPARLAAWWLRLSEDPEFLREQQALFCGPGAMLAVSSGDGKLAYPSAARVEFNGANDVLEILARHGYIDGGRGRWAPPTATGAPAVRAIAGKQGLYQSDHASDPLHGTFDAWTAYVVLDHGGELSAAEAAWAITRTAGLLVGFSEVAPAPANAPIPLPAFKRVAATGEIKSSKDNVVMGMQRPDVCGFKVRHDTFREEVMIALQGTEGWRSLKDTDMTQLCLNLERGGFQNISKDLIRDAISFVAEQNAFDSAQHWLDLKVWDGVPRIEQFLPGYMGTADTAYTRAVGLYIWSAMAGRVCAPGIKADMVPVAVGAQGTRKSSAVASLVPSEEFFTTIDLSGQDDDLARKMRGKLIVELDELKGLASRDAEHIKSFASRRFEEWTPKYREQTVRYPRRSICFGTSNQDDFLVDATGNRRWLPFDCGMCDTDAIARDRDQLWAEGRAVFLQSGIQHVEAERLANAEHGGFAAHDDWDVVIAKWLTTEEFTGGTPGGREFLTGSEVLSAAIGLPIAQQSPAHSARIKRSMVRLGYVYKNLRHNGGRNRVFLAPSLF